MTLACPVKRSHRGPLPPRHPSPLRRLGNKSPNAPIDRSLYLTPTDLNSDPPWVGPARARWHSSAVDRQPDIVVASPDEAAVHLVVEVKVGTHDVRATERQLKQIMLRMRAPVGLLVTPQQVRIFRDTFAGNGDESVIDEGSIPTSSIAELQSFALGYRREAFEFEEAVQEWLEGLRYRLTQGYGRGPDALLAKHVMPALSLGEIRPMGPRQRLTATR